MRLTKDLIPAKYAVCEQSTCACAKTCLHNLAYKPLVETDNPHLNLINPSLCTKNKECKFYRDSAKVTYARGFMNMQKRMYPEQYLQFMHRLINRYSRYMYFSFRKGEKILYPDQQQEIISIASQVGVDGEFVFDNYEQDYLWYK